jgi:hypothetical protein
MMADIEFVLIDENTDINSFVNDLRAGTLSGNKPEKALTPRPQGRGF